MSNNKIAIYGAGGFGREVFLLIHHLNEAGANWEMTGFYDDEIPPGTIINDYKILGGTEALNTNSENISVVFAIGNPPIKKQLLSKLNNKLIRFPTLIHPSVKIRNEQHIEIGEGSIICEGNILTTNIRIGAHVILNLACTTGHDVLIEDFCSIMPGARISGEVKIRELVYIGTGATIINQIEIGNASIIGAGAVVIKDIPAHCTAVGVPARKI